MSTGPGSENSLVDFGKNNISGDRKTICNGLRSNQKTKKRRQYTRNLAMKRKRAIEKEKGKGKITFPLLQTGKNFHVSMPIQ